MMKKNTALIFNSEIPYGSDRRRRRDVVTQTIMITAETETGRRAAITILMTMTGKWFDILKVDIAKTNGT